MGHSQGTTQAFAAFSENQEIAESVSVFCALAPVAQVGSWRTGAVHSDRGCLRVAQVYNTGSKLLRLLADLDAAAVLKLLGVYSAASLSCTPCIYRALWDQVLMTSSRTQPRMYRVPFALCCGAKFVLPAFSLHKIFGVVCDVSAHSAMTEILAH